MTRLLLAALSAASLASLAGPAAAEVASRSENAFRLTFERPVTASPEAILAAAGRPAAWWSDAHTYSGSAANITVDLQPGGCWCEALPGGGVKHAETVLVWPGERMVMFEAPFGPLRGIGADAVLTMSWADPEGGAARTLKWTFVVNGPGAGAMADVIDGVTAEQFGRLVDHLGGAAGS
ncbi:ATPase [Brevundimonas sp.]|uniref:ATPase n=1 Tax=Brevundimonas sp. TaxID=1871086 RepID=UPI002D2602A2|nr:ATPase [Brevundimonas sp.]HYC68136.1 ATPase [Brevundimonas sp.]